jgi:YqxM protein
MNIRYSRLRKFPKKSNRLVGIVVQLLVIIYISTLIIGYATSNTNAYFIVKHEITEKIQASTWEEQSPKNAVESPITTTQVDQNQTNTR